MNYDMNAEHAKIEPIDCQIIKQLLASLESRPNEDGLDAIGAYSHKACSRQDDRMRLVY